MNMHGDDPGYYTLPENRDLAAQYLLLNNTLNVDKSSTRVIATVVGGETRDQWLYLPALKRVKRISSSNKSGPFVGSEFAYEDISS
jgi:hypothetical protein